MKLRYVIPPVVAFILAGAWNIMQARNIALLEREGRELKEKIAAVTPRGGARNISGSPNTQPSSGGRIDWQSIAAQLSGESGADELSNMRETLAFQKRLEKMTTKEMVDALDEIAKVDLPGEQRENLESVILGSLIETDPALALNHCADRISGEPQGLGWQLSEALQNWAKTDLAAATAWFDKQIAAGTFDSKTLDGRSELRVQYEGALLESLLEADPNAAAQRLEAMPQDQRREVLQQISFGELSNDSQKSYADIVRDLVPQDERSGSFAHIASELVEEGGFTQVGNFLNSVNASSAERVAAAKEAADSHLEELGQNGKITQVVVDEMREWLETQAPGQTDSITGKALGEAAQDDGKFTFAEASQLALKYNEAGKNDDVLVGFLQSFAARSNLEEAKQLADLIRDQTRRDQILKQLR